MLDDACFDFHSQARADGLTIDLLGKFQYAVNHYSGPDFDYPVELTVPLKQCIAMATRRELTTRQLTDFVGLTEQLSRALGLPESERPGDWFQTFEQQIAKVMSRAG